MKNIEKLFNNPSKFIALKFHPINRGISPKDLKYRPYMDFASKHKIPCLFHSTITVDNIRGKRIIGVTELSEPKFIYNLVNSIGESNWKRDDQSYGLIFGTDAPIDRFKETNTRQAYDNYVESIKDAIRNDNNFMLEYNS